MKDLENPAYVENYGFMCQWCCKCKACHIWHFEIIRGKTEEKDYVVISHAGYPELDKLLKFYEKGRRKK
jgi:hypothetical protein